MSGQQPEERVDKPALTQVWESVSFLHWAYEPAAVASLLPDGLVPDLHEGEAWVGITPFLVSESSVAGVPVVGPPAAYPETNVRTYVRGPDGSDGIFFLSIEADSLVTSIATRAMAGAPYRWADMEVVRDAASITYTSRRHALRGDRPGHRIVVRPGEPLAEVDELTTFLTGRWRAWVERAGSLMAIPVEHPPWPLRAAELVELQEDLLASCGLPSPAASPIVHHADRVRASLGAPRSMAEAPGPQP